MKPKIRIWQNFKNLFIRREACFLLECAAWQVKGTFTRNNIRRCHDKLTAAPPTPQDILQAVIGGGAEINAVFEKLRQKQLDTRAARSRDL